MKFCELDYLLGCTVDTVTGAVPVTENPKPPSLPLGTIICKWKWQIRYLELDKGKNISLA